MYVDGLLHIWDVGSGQLLARMAGKEGFLEAMYHDNEQILIAEVTKRSFLGFPKGIKVLKLKLDPILDQYAALYIPSRTTPWATNTNEGSLLSGNFDGSEDETTAMYSLLTGVRILTEEQLLSNIVGNTLARKNSTGGDWAEYYEPPKGDQRKGEIIGKSSKPYSGQWNISGSLMCFDYGGSAGDGCWILSLDEYTVTWYKPNGEKKDESKFPTKLIPGDPEGLGPDTAFSTNITGTYVSDVRGGWAGILGGNRKLKITLEQSGKDIIGTDVNQKKIVAGTRKKDTIKFKYYGRGGQLTGKWKINSDGTKLEGTWNSSREDGKWNLTRIE